MERGCSDREESAENRRRSRSASRGRFAESWKRLSSKQGSTKRSGLPSQQTPEVVFCANAFKSSSYFLFYHIQCNWLYEVVYLNNFSGLDLTLLLIFFSLFWMFSGLMIMWDSITFCKSFLVMDSASSALESGIASSRGKHLTGKSNLACASSIVWSSISTLLQDIPPVFLLPGLFWKHVTIDEGNMEVIDGKGQSSYGYQPNMAFQVANESETHKNLTSPFGWFVLCDLSTGLSARRFNEFATWTSILETNIAV
ncbi:hypothetical protein STEG23_027021 [Scotinomys teguina]